MILGGEIVETEEIPMDEIIFLRPKRHPITGEIDLEETAKNSVVMTNVGAKREEE